MYIQIIVNQDDAMVHKVLQIQIRKNLRSTHVHCDCVHLSYKNNDELLMILWELNLYNIIFHGYKRLFLSIFCFSNFHLLDLKHFQCMHLDEMFVTVILLLIFLDIAKSAEAAFLHNML